ncbi:MAG TPA: hypothetical protein DHN33_07995 [Eubacteriaceae bacterium]|nr:hypothetical protein [Eubacteriaceae bacterium]
MKKRRIIVYTLSQRGIDRIKNHMDELQEQYLVTVYAFDKKGVKKSTETFPIQYFQDLKEAIRQEFQQGNLLFFILSTGIVIRSIQGLLLGKQQDPALVVMDEKGNHVISLLSGHLGGANEETQKLAEIFGANPVITTASDVYDSMAVDTFALSHGLHIKDLQAAKRVTALILDGNPVAIVNEAGISINQRMLPDHVRVIEEDKEREVESENRPYGTMVITTENKEADNPQTVILVAKDIIVGAGCRRGVASEDFLRALKEELHKQRIDPDAVSTIASIDRKEDETCILEAAKELKAATCFYTKEQLQTVEDRFSSSMFVKNKVGVGAVAETSACLASQDGEAITKRVRYPDITLSIWRRKR